MGFSIRGFRDVDLKLGWLTLFFGVNASDKTNFLNHLHRRLVQRSSSAFSDRLPVAGPLQAAASEGARSWGAGPPVSTPAGA